MDTRRPRAYWRYPPGAMDAPPGGWAGWLGRPPSGRVGPGLRAVTAVARVLFALAGHRVAPATGPLPAGHVLFAGAPHRSELDALVVVFALPPEPRPWGFAMAPATAGHRLFGPLLRRTGGVIPVWRGEGFDGVVAAGRTVLDAGGHLVVMPEGGVTAPDDRLAELRPGAVLLAARLGVPLVPLVIRRRRRLFGSTWRVELLPALDLTPPPGTEPGSRAELRWARTATDELTRILETAWLGTAGPAAEPAPDPAAASGPFAAPPAADAPLTAEVPAAGG